jgi:hypothetical protein
MQDHPKRVERVEAAIDAHLAELYAEVPEASDLPRAILRAAFGVGYGVCLNERPRGRFAREHGYAVPSARKKEPEQLALTTEPAPVEDVREDAQPAQGADPTRPETWECWACEATISSSVQACPNCGSPNVDPRGTTNWSARRARGMGPWDNFIDVFAFARACGCDDEDATEYATEVTGQAGPEAAVV